MQMKFAANGSPAQRLPYKWEVILEIRYVDFHIPYLGDSFNCVNF